MVLKPRVGASSEEACGLAHAGRTSPSRTVTRMGPANRRAGRNGGIMHTARRRHGPTFYQVLGARGGNEVELAEQPADGVPVVECHRLLRGGRAGPAVEPADGGLDTRHQRRVDAELVDAE